MTAIAINGGNGGAHAFGVADMLSPRTGFRAIVDDDDAGVLSVGAATKRDAAGRAPQADRIAFAWRLAHSPTPSTCSEIEANRNSRPLHWICAAEVSGIAAQ